MPTSGTLLFLDYQSSANIGVVLIPNFDGEAYPHTVLEMAVSNPRALTSLEQLEGAVVHNQDFGTVSYLENFGPLEARIDGMLYISSLDNPEKFVPEISDVMPTIDPDRSVSSLRINDISGPAINKIWEEEPAPDDQRRTGI